MSTVNLLPEDYLVRRSQQRANVLCLILFAVVMAGVVGAAVMSEQKSARARRDREQVYVEYRRASELIARMQELEAKKNDVVSKAQMASELLERVPRSYLLAELTNALPASDSLTEVKLLTTQPKVVKATTKHKSKFRARQAARAKTAKAKADADANTKTPVKRPPPLVMVEAIGLAQTDVHVAQFISRMHNCPLMRSVELGYSEQQQVGDAVVRKFLVTMQLDPKVTVTAATADAPGPAIAERTEP